MELHPHQETGNVTCFGTKAPVLALTQTSPVQLTTG